MAWRLAKALETLRAQINKGAPQRSKISDGTIGDAAHSSRASDHNPNPSGVVCALDVTHDPAGGCSAESIAGSLKASNDPRIGYIIWNRRISNPAKEGGAWRAYSGANPHTKHVHISVKQEARFYDDPRDWAVNVTPTETVTPTTPRPAIKPTLRKGLKGNAVRELQALLGVKADGDFGPQTKDAVIRFQRDKGIVADGIVGSYTWEALLNKAVPSTSRTRLSAKSYQVSKKGVQHVKEFEGCVLKAHKVGGIWHIGYGHSETSGRSPIPKEGMTVTEADAEVILISDLRECEVVVAELVTTPITQGEFDALVSIAFNKGTGWFRTSDLLERVNAQDWEGAAQQILSAVPHDTHRFYRGLLRRRQAEAALFRS